MILRDGTRFKCVVRIMTAYRVLIYKTGKAVVVFNAVDWYILYSHASKYYTYISTRS